MLGFITKPFKRDAIATELDYLLGGQAEPAESERLAAKARPLIFDPSQSDEMLSLLGAEVVQGLLDSLSNEGRENLTMLEMAIEQRRYEEGQRAAHTLKSSSKALGLIALSESMASIESQFACGELPRTESLKQAQTAFDEGLAMLREHVSLA